MAMTKGPHRWAWPLWGITLVGCLSAGALCAAVYAQLLPFPLRWAAFAACALCILCCTVSTVWSHRIVGRALRRNRFHQGIEQRLEVMGARVEASDIWLRERQETLTDLHTQVVQQAMATITQVAALNTQQQNQQDKMLGFLADMPPLLGSLSDQLNRWSAVDTAMLSKVARQAQADGAAFSRAVVHSVAGLVAATVPIEDAALAMSEASAKLDGVVEGSRVGMLTSLKTLDQAKTALEASATQIAPQVNRLNDLAEHRDAMKETQHKERFDAVDARLEALGDTLEAGFSTATAQELSPSNEALAADIRDMTQSAAATAKTLRAQVRRVGDEITGQTGEVLAGLKHLRVNQLQSIKQTIRAMPEAVASQITPTIQADIRAVQDKLDTLALSALSQADAADAGEQTGPSLDDIALTLGARLARALETMRSIEQEITGLAAAALSAPDDAAASKSFAHVMVEAEQALRAWGGCLENVTTAVALARDAS